MRLNTSRQKIKIKKIENGTARQVTFSKRKKGLFKKAQELSTLCDAQLAILIFSSSGKLFDFSSSPASSVNQVLERHPMHPKNRCRLNHPPLDMQVENNNYVGLNNKVAEKNHELSQMMGEELLSLSVGQLEELEELLQRGLQCVLERKDARNIKEIDDLTKKVAQLHEEKLGLEHQTQIESHSFESVMNMNSSTSEQTTDNSFDISLKLGLPFPR